MALRPVCKSRPTIIPHQPGAENWLLPSTLCRKQHLTKQKFFSELKGRRQNGTKTIKCTTFFSDSESWIACTSRRANQHLYPSSLLDKWLRALAPWCDHLWHPICRWPPFLSLSFHPKKTNKRCPLNNRMSLNSRPLCKIGLVCLQPKGEPSPLTFFHLLSSNSMSCGSNKPF